MSNRIMAAVEKLDGIIATLPEEKVAQLEKVATLDPHTWTVLGDRATLGLSEGRITTEEACSLHMIHQNFTHVGLAERMVFIQTVTELAR